MSDSRDNKDIARPEQERSAYSDAYYRTAPQEGRSDYGYNPSRYYHDEDDDTYQPGNFHIDDDFYGFDSGKESEFSAAGYSLKEGSDDDDLEADDGEGTDDDDEGDFSLSDEVILDDGQDD